MSRVRLFYRRKAIIEKVGQWESCRWSPVEGCSASTLHLIFLGGQIHTGKGDLGYILALNLHHHLLIAS